MATLLLQNAGAALGSALFGPVGAIFGRVAGAYAGSLIDRRLFGEDETVSGPRLEQARIMASSEGAPIARVYGRVRIGGQLIWATRFEEVTTRHRQGGKGAGPTVTTVEHAYFANFAIALCEGEIAAVRRIWADGNEIDQTRFEIRIYRGTEDQPADPLIEAKQGAGNAPAYRGTAYVVFERFALADFGNRIPQLSFEVIRSVSRLDRAIEAVTIIPGATELGYSPLPESKSGNGTTGGPRNRNNLTHESDWAASLDELTALCPNLKRVALVVAWYGNDLRAGTCEIRPKVEYSDTGGTWRVSGLTRKQVGLVSRYEGKPAYGGTPSDHSVMAAIADLRSRGLEVFLYPFVMMDIAAGNALADPYGGAEQASYPWRGRITCHPAPGQPDSGDATPIARGQIESFLGIAAPENFAVAGSTVAYLGPAEWSYRRMVLHYAALAANAGVDGFLIGSEMAAATIVRDENGNFPFVEGLRGIVAHVRAMIGPDAMVTYAADWTEYSGYQPAGTGDRFFHLDSLWADANIDAVGIDNYMPLADWRTEGDPGDPNVPSQFAPEYLAGNIEGGEGYAWYYVSTDDRLAGIRTPIADGMGEQWLWRVKDIRNWWMSPHHERIGGVRQAEPTAWQPMAKPILFTELGCGAVTMGANQPNRFADEKSAERGLPYFSTGVRSDLAQNRFLLAHHDYWSDEARNPVSPAYGGRMISRGHMFVWAWDARPFPEFPADTDRWSDGGNWHTGHWLNGRLGGCPLDDLLIALAADSGVDATVRCDGHLDGFVIADPAAPRDALQPLAELFGVSLLDRQGAPVFSGFNYAESAQIDDRHLVAAEDEALVTRTRQRDIEVPAEAGLRHGGVFANYESQQSYSRRLEAGHDRRSVVSLPAILPRSAAIGALELGLRNAWIGRERAQIALPRRYLHLEPGDLIEFGQAALEGPWRIASIEDGEWRRLQLRAAARFEPLPAPADDQGEAKQAPQIYGEPLFYLMNLPLQPENEKYQVHAALMAEPWARNYGIWSSPTLDGFQFRSTVGTRAITGLVREAVGAGVEGRWDLANRIIVDLADGELESLPDGQMLNGANAAAIRAQNGEWEIIQFSVVELLEDGGWVLSRLLRGQMGTDPAMQSAIAAGAPLVLLDAGVQAIELAELENGLDLNWRAGPAAEPVSSPTYASLSHRHEAVARRPYSPVHLTANRNGNGDVVLKWIRRTRIGGDAWEGADVPLGEAGEMYRVTIGEDAGSALRVIETPTPQVTYAASDQIADFGQLPGTIIFSVVQLSSSGLAGAARTHTAAV
jgi:GTA TIM-barrel-like domain/Putative phage tail protein